MILSSSVFLAISLTASGLAAVLSAGYVVEQVPYDSDTYASVQPIAAILPEAPFIDSLVESDSSEWEQALNAHEFLSNAYLDAHNAARSQHGAHPLSWSNALAQKAQNWANGCKFQHSGSGENLAAGTGTYGPQNAVKAWMDEQPQYNPSNPQPSHFTQVVWKSTSQLGCAVKKCPPGSIFPPQFGDTYYHVCEYSPAGNVIGQFPENVQK